mgnify:CR=1 FL=1
MTEAVFKGMYPYFGVAALAVILWRIVTGRWTKAETMILICLLFHTVGQIVQVAVGDGKLDMSRRYFLPAAPLLFVWTAYGVDLITWRYRRTFCIHRKYLIAVVVMLVILLFYDGFAPTLKGIYSERKRGEAVLVEKAVIVIQNDYHGVWRDNSPVDKLIYHSPYRPVVWSEFPSIGFRAGGRSEPSPFGDIPDYWVLRAGVPPPSGAYRLAEIDAQGFSYIIYKKTNPQ